LPLPLARAEAILMFTKLAGLVALTLVIPALADDTPKKPDSPKGDEAAAKEVAKLQGTWAVVSVEQDGQAVGADDVKSMRLVVKGNERVLRNGDEVLFRTTFKLDPTKSPKQIDLTPADGPADRPILGIYELKDDSMKVCLALGGGDRPKEFKGGPGVTLAEYRREPKSDQELIQGTWTLESAERGGKNVDLTQEQHIPSQFVFSDGKVELKAGPRTMGGTFKLDAGQTPKALTMTAGGDGATTIAAIYSLEGDTLKVCVDEANLQARPKEIKSADGTRVVVAVFKRAKK
jgi:uncharacterized protein (TIGR03067 family)